MSAEHSPISNISLFIEALPFAYAYLIESFGYAIPKIASNMFDATKSPKDEFDAGLKEKIVKFGTLLNAQIGFFCALLLSSVTALIHAMNTPLTAILAVVSLLAMLVFWFFRWSTMAEPSLKKRERIDWEMKMASYTNITIMLVLTLYSRIG